MPVDYQIILLPERNYWEWVRACSDYVLAHGANLTSDLQSAARYMAPMQVVTYPIVDGWQPASADLPSWFDEHQPGVRLDPIAAGTPKQLKKQLKRRLKADDRYGQRQKPFFLLWPTDYAIVTQKFGANPRIYTRFGMPGHEGLDIRALPNSNIYACAAGRVYLVHTNPGTHAYGIHVRIRHDHGYRTVYGHLAKAVVEPDQQVEAGQVIGLADSTGASTAAHLHMTLKQDGATARKETKYPKDVVDPTPFMVWPEAYRSKQLSPPAWPAGRCLIGVHGPIDRPMEDSDLELVEQADLEAVKLEHFETDAAIAKLRRARPDLFLVVRLGMDFSRDSVTAEAFVEHVGEDVERLIQAGIRQFEVGSTPNLQTDGWNRSWSNGEEYARWFIRVVNSLKGRHKHAQIGFPGLSPGGAISGWREDALRFLDDAAEAVTIADWLGVNLQWTNITGLRSPEGGLGYLAIRQRFPDKLIMITEFCNPASDVSHDVKAQQYVEFYRMLREEPGLAAAFAYPLGAKTGYQASAWKSDGRSGKAYSERLGKRGF